MMWRIILEAMVIGILLPVLFVAIWVGTPA